MPGRELRTGILGGSFNPLHIGHLAIANYLCEEGWVDELWLLVTPQNPLKPQSGLLDGELRLKMAMQAVGDYPKIKVSNFEFSLPCPSYTLNTLQALSAAFPHRHFHWVIGSDNWHDFHRWYHWQELLQKYPFIIYPRPGYPVDPAALPAGVQLADAPLIDINSTAIRRAAAQGKDLRFYMPAPVARMVQELKLYQNPL